MVLVVLEVVLVVLEVTGPQVPWGVFQIRLSLSPMKDHQYHPQDHQNHLQDHQNHTYKEPPKGGCLLGWF